MTRDRALDIVKGIGIILVVLGHAYAYHNWLIQLIGAFHMPCFFMVSGMLYRTQYAQKGVCVFRFKAKVKALLLPWLLWGSCYQILIGILRILGGESLSSASANFRHAFLTLGMGSVWFLPALFGATWLFLATLPRPKLNRGVTLACLVIGLFAPNWEGFPNTVLRAMLACGFLGIGFYGKDLLRDKRWPSAALAILAVVFVLLAQLNGPVSMHNRTLQFPPLYLLNSLLGSLLLIQLSCRLDTASRKIAGALALLGQRSMVILCTHQMLLEAILLTDHKLTGGMLRESGLWEGLILTPIIIFLTAACLPLCDRYFYTLFGYQKQEKKHHV